MQNNIKKLSSVIAGVICMFLLIACSGEYIYRKDVEQLSKPGALDLPLTGFYSHYQYKLLDRYQVKHQWLRESNCQYSKIESEKYESKDRLTKDRFFDVDDIYEEGNSTWQRDDTRPARNFDRFVRAEYLSGPNGNGVYRIEKGYNVLGFESWWTTSHSIAFFLRKQPLDEMKAGFSKWFPEGVWTTKKVNNLTWYVQETSEDKFRPRPLNGVGGPFQTWVLPLADTGYTMAIELGASKESLQYPEVQARMLAMLRHLIESVKIEPIPATPDSTSQVLSVPAQPAPPFNHINPNISQPMSGTTSTTIREYPDKTFQLQQNIQNDSNHDMKNLLRNVAPKTKR